MGSRSKQKSVSTSTTRTETNTQNMSLDNVDGVTIAGSDNITVNMTDSQAFDLLGRTFEGVYELLDSSQTKALETVADTTIRSFEKVNESNRSESEAMVSKAVTVAAIGSAAYAAVKIFGK